MSKELKKFIAIFAGLTFALTLLGAIIMLFVAEHWIIGIVVSIPSVAALIAAVETDMPILLFNLWTKEQSDD
jgi:hypothetical protein